MTKSSIFFQNKFYIELAIATVLFFIAVIMDMLMVFIIYMLYFIIFLEIVRAVMNYIREQKVRMKFLIDAFIILALRELIVNVVKVNDANIESFDQLFSNAINFNLMVISGVIIFLFFARYLSIVTSTAGILSKDKTIEDIKSKNQ